ncbi:hypothetical protein B0H12DRAFT_1069001 [Mycena haematopus]|nr:hypothetical protein B0H12DRAFT_1069001 [Mycena haematopus]
MTSRSGLALPLPATFDFLAYSTQPADVAGPANMNLKIKNTRNVAIETANNTSITHTLAYEAAVISGTSLANLDVGAPLVPFFEYTAEERALLSTSDKLCTATGPLPTFLIEYIAGQDLLKAQADLIEKAKRDKERDDKAKSIQPLAGSMHRKNPHAISAALSSPVSIPPIFIISLFHKIRIPLHWWTDSVLRDATENPQFVLKERMRAEQTAAPVAADWIQVLDVKGMAKILGDDEDSNDLTPSTWRQASLNLLKAYQELSPKPDANAVDTRTYATEFELHIRFFASIRYYDEMFEIWYPVERRLRAEIFNDANFDQAVWDSRVEIAYSSNEIIDARMSSSSRASSMAPPSRSSSLAPLSSAKASGKRRAENDGNSAPPKSQRIKTGGRERADSGASRADAGASRIPPTGSSPLTCLCCTGPHGLSSHPADSSTYRDGAAFFTKPEGRKGLRTVNSFRGNDRKDICIIYNVGGKCDGEHNGKERLHVCSLCGGEHPALSLDAKCGRVRDGALLP